MGFFEFPPNLEIAKNVRLFVQGGRSRNVVTPLVEGGCQVIRKFLSRKVSAVAWKHQLDEHAVRVASLAQFFSGVGAESRMARHFQGYLDKCDKEVEDRFIKVAWQDGSEALRAMLEPEDVWIKHFLKKIKGTFLTDPRIHAFKPWIKLTSEKEIRPSGPEWTITELNAFLFEIQSQGEHRKNWVYQLLVIVSGDERRPNVLRIDFLLTAIQSVLRETLKDNQRSWMQKSASRQDRAFKFRRAYQRTCQYVVDRLTKSRERGGLDEVTLRRFRHGLFTWLLEFRYSPQELSAYQSLEWHWPGLTREYYNENLKGSYEEHVRCVKNKFIEYLKEELE